MKPHQVSSACNVDRARCVVRTDPGHTLGARNVVIAAHHNIFPFKELCWQRNDLYLKQAQTFLCKLPVSPLTPPHGRPRLQVADETIKDQINANKR